MSRFDVALAQITEEQATVAVATSYCKCNVVPKLPIPQNGMGVKIVASLIEKYNIDISHFDSRLKNRKYDKITKHCPICEQTFVTSTSGKREQATCSTACANKHFRSGTDNPNHIAANSRPECERPYQFVCWRHHKRCCVVCNESNIVEAHHYNGDHSDNRPENFVPLCPTHHQYWHSRFRNLIETKVREYVATFSEQQRVAQR